jgi:NADPH2:quinone reductase
MHAVVVERPGGLEELRLAEVPDPVPVAGEVLIEVAFSGCNWSDVQ